MMTLRSDLIPLRRSIFVALGLLACGPDPGGTASGSASSSSTGGSSTGSSSGIESSGLAPTSGGPGVSASSGSSTGEPSTSTTTQSGSSTSPDTSSGTGSSSSGSSGDTGIGPDCTPLMQGMTNPPVPSGWVKCGDDLPHRVEAVACVEPTAHVACDIMDPMFGCQTDDDCVEKPLGSCHKSTIFGLTNCGCVYGCETDADCSPGEVCRCAGDVLGEITTCVASSCKDDSECGEEVCQFAQSFGYDCPKEVIEGACTTPADLCHSDTPCVDSPCKFEDGKWQCSLIACGRPFVVDERAVLAPAAARDDWRGVAPVPRAAGDLRARLAARWTHLGRCEHASIASFARWTLQLLALGAPAELVSAAQQALADEVEHARACFALASLYNGTGVGPGPLPGAEAPVATALEEVVAAVIREACVGETLSALEAREAATRAEDPALRRVLEKIAADEERHAELGWRFVRWALAGAPPEVRAGARAAFEAAIAAATQEAAALAAELGDPELRAHGLVDDPLRAAVWQRGLRELIEPTARLVA